MSAENIALRYDDRVVRGLCCAIVTQAVRDWKKLNRDGKWDSFTTPTEIVYRFELTGFFNSSFFGEILNLVIAPGVTQEQALQAMDRAKFHPNALSCGKSSSLQNYAEKKRKGKRK